MSKHPGPTDKGTKTVPGRRHLIGRPLQDRFRPRTVIGEAQIPVYAHFQ